MGTFRLMLVEDNDSEIKTCRSSIAKYTDENKCNIDLVVCKSLDEFRQNITKDIDGAIIDLKLSNNGDEGNKAVSEIQNSFYRIPIAILTGTPNAADTNNAYIGIYKKGEDNARYEALLHRFREIQQTGIINILGGKGIIEKSLADVFHKNILPQTDKWITYGRTNPGKIEFALLRHTLSHLLHLIEDDHDQYYPEEFYITPPTTDKYRTGSIISHKKSGIFYVVMNPSCDLVIRANGHCNTDRVLIAEVDTIQTVFPNLPAPADQSKSQQGELTNAYNNKKALYYHWMPPTAFFAGGFLNFRKLSTYTHEVIAMEFTTPTIQISPVFIKDIISRFSTYYARQGQPEINMPTP